MKESRLLNRRQGSVLALVAVLAIVGGVVLPQFLPEERGGDVPQAQEKDWEYRAPNVPPPVSVQALLTRLAVGSVAVAGLSVVVLWALKRWGSSTFLNAPGRPANMKVLETIALGYRCSLHVVGVHNQKVLVGMDAQGIKSMLVLNEPFDNLLDTEAEESQESSATSRAA